MAPGSRRKRVRKSDQSDLLTFGAQTRSLKMVQTAEREMGTMYRKLQMLMMTYQIARPPRLADYDI